jgi:hypothetical protein
MRGRPQLASNCLGPGDESAFNQIGFAITDWSPEQRVIGPFQHVFAAAE